MMRLRIQPRWPAQGGRSSQSTRLAPTGPSAESILGHRLTHDTLLWLLVGLSLIPIWITRYPPLQDYPDWLLQAQILRHLNDPGLGFSAYYTALNAPVPNLGSIALIYLFSFVAPLEIAGKLALSCYVIAFPLAVVYFLRAVLARPTALEYLSVLLVYNYFFYMGYIGYLLGLALLMALIGNLWRCRFQPTGRGWLVLTLGSTGLFLTHMMPWATLGFVCFSWVVLWRKQLGVRQLLRLAAAFVPSLILLVFYVRMSADQLVIVPYPLSVLPYKLSSFIEPLILASGFRPWPNVAPPLLVNGALLVGAGAVTGMALRAARQQARAADVALLDSSALLSAFGLVAMIMVLPYWFGGLLRPDERLTIPTALLLLAAVRWPRPTRRLDAALALMVMGMLVFHTATFVRGGNEMARLVNGLAPFISREEHPYFLRVPGACTQSFGEHWLLPVIEPGPRAGFYLSAQRGGGVRQLLDTGLITVKSPIPFNYRLPWPWLLSQLEVLLPDMQATVFPDYNVIALFGCPEPIQQVAGQLAPALTPVTDPEIPRSPYLCVLQRPDVPQP